MIQRTCTKCLISKPLDDFYNLRRGLYGKHSRCKSCHVANTISWQKAHPTRTAELLKVSRRKWRLNHPEKEKATARRNHLKLRYGIPEQLRDIMIEIQGNACACCKRTDMKRLVTDHKHGTGIIRGWICDACNLTIGMLENHPQRVYHCVAYLQGHEEMTRKSACA